MAWILLAVLAFAPPYTATDYTTTTISLAGQATFTFNLTTKQFTINSVDHRDWILCDSIYGKNISAKIGGVMTYYDLSNPFVYRQDKPSIEVLNNRTLFNTTHPGQKSRNGWFQVNGSRYSYPYGNSSTESPIAVLFKGDSLKLNTSLANIDVMQRRTERSDWKWKSVSYSFRLYIENPAVKLKYAEDNCVFMSPRAFIDCSPNSFKIWTTDNGVYMTNLYTNLGAYKSLGGQRYSLSSSSNDSSETMVLQSNRNTIVLSDGKSTQITHRTWGDTVYKATLLDYLAENVNQSYYYDIWAGTVQLSLNNKTVITVDVRHATVKGPGGYTEHNRWNDPRDVWYSDEFGTRVAFYDGEVKIDGQWKFQIGRHFVKNEHGTITWELGFDGLPAKISYAMSNRGDAIVASTQPMHISINDFRYYNYGRVFFPGVYTYFFKLHN